MLSVDFNTYLATITLEIFIYRQSTILIISFKKFYKFLILRSFEAHCQDGETYNNLYEDFRTRGVTSKALTTGIDEVVYIVLHSRACCKSLAYLLWVWVVRSLSPHTTRAWRCGCKARAYSSASVAESSVSVEIRHVTKSYTG